MIDYARRLLASGLCRDIERARRCIGRDCDRESKCTQIKTKLDMIELDPPIDHDYEQSDYLTGSYSVLPFGETSYWYRDQDFINGLLWCANSLDINVSRELPGYVWNSTRGRVPIIQMKPAYVDSRIIVSATQQDIEDQFLHRANDAVERYVEGEVNY